MTRIKRGREGSALSLYAISVRKEKSGQRCDISEYIVAGEKMFADFLYRTVYLVFTKTVVFQREPQNL